MRGQTRATRHDQERAQGDHRRRRPLPDRLRTRHPRRRCTRDPGAPDLAENQSKALRARKAELELDVDQPPQPLAPAQLSAIRNRIRQVLAHEAHTTRKALFEALIQEITITADDTVRPVFKLPLVGYDEGPDSQGPARTECDANQMVRALPTMVGDTGIEPVTSPV